MKGWKEWKCPSCKRTIHFEEDKKLVMKVCWACQVEMEVVGDE